VGQQRHERVCKALGGKVKRRRQNLGLTQEDVADEMGIAARHYQKIEAGELNLTIRTLIRVAEALSIELKDLF